MKFDIMYFTLLTLIEPQGASYGEHVPDPSAISNLAVHVNLRHYMEDARALAEWHVKVLGYVRLRTADDAHMSDPWRETPYVMGRAFHSSTSQLNQDRFEQLKPPKPAHVSRKMFQRQAEKWTSASQCFSVLLNSN